MTKATDFFYGDMNIDKKESLDRGSRCRESAIVLVLEGYVVISIHPYIHKL